MIYIEIQKRKEATNTSRVYQDNIGMATYMKMTTNVKKGCG